MNERSIFLDALEQDSPTLRSAFLDTSCAGDAALRQRVEALLRSHEEAGDFLGKLAPQRVAEHLAVGQTTDPTQDGTPHADDGSDDLAFLTPADKPGSLGRLGHFDIQEVIGRGGMGIVLRAFDERLHRVVAIKVMAAQLATAAMARKRFAREAHAAAAVSHDHIVTIHAVEEANGLPYIVMHFVAGMSLQERLDRGGPLELPEILRIGMQTAAGLVAAHAQGLIHRDIKPANILLENGVERVKITDFGLARAAADASLTQSGAVAGTPHYMAPEQARGDALDARTDLFSLGSVLYAMCTGRSPFRASGSMAVLKRVCEETPTPIRETNPEIPEWLVAIIDKLHAKDPAERFQSAAEVAELLSRHLAHVQHPSVAPLPAVPVGAASRAAPAPARLAGPTHRWAVAAAVLLFCLLGGLSVTEATGVTQLVSTVIRILTSEGTLVVEVDDPEVKVSIEGDGGLVITGAGLQQVRLKPGSYKVQAVKDGKPVELDQELVTITRGGKQVVKVRLESAAATGAEFGAPWRGWPKDAPPPAVAPFDVEQAKAHQEAWAKHLALPLDDTNSIGMRFQLIPPGEFTMGTSQEVTRQIVASAGSEVVKHETEAIGNEGVPHPVRLTKPFYLGQFEVTRAQFGRFVEHTGYKTVLERSGLGGWSHFEGKWVRRPEHIWSTPGEWQVSDDEPACHLTWSDAQAFCEWLSEEEGRQYVLPTEAQWEYACRAGTTGLTYAGFGKNRADIAWTNELTGEYDLARHRPQPVGRKQLNAFGLYDMLGNVWEHCSDWYGPGSQRDELRIDPTGPTQGDSAVARGGAWYRSGRLFARCGARLYTDREDKSDAGVGFRVAIVGLLKPTKAQVKATNAMPPAESSAFVVLGGKGVAERKFDTLAEAVVGSSDGDTIEVRGNGPFVSEPISIRGTALTIRAGEGFRPVIQLSANLQTDAPLVLEGLELQHLRQQAPQGWEDALVVSQNHPLHVANCRFREHLAIPSIVAYTPRCFVRNCEFLNPAQFALVSTGKQCVIDNCLIAGQVLQIENGIGPGHDGGCSVQLTRNTLAAASPLFFRVIPTEPTKLPQGDVKPIRVEASGNIFGATSVLVLNVHPPFVKNEKPLEPKEAAALLWRFLNWRDRLNLYAPGASYVSGYVDERVTIGAKNLTDWKRFWEPPEGDAIEGRVLYQGGNLVAKLLATPEKLTPDDFRLRADSAGYKAGQDGKDLGADVDLVGPGPAYERWKKTPEYQEWLNETGQLK